MVSAGGQRGIGLIELMVVVALMLLLALGGSALTASWVDQAAMRQSQAQLRQAMAELKAQALRNPEARPMGEAAAVLLSLPGRLCVHRGRPDELACAGARWQATPPARIQLAEQDSACLAMDSAGQLLDSAVGEGLCTTELAYRIARHKEEPVNGWLE